MSLTLNDKVTFFFKAFAGRLDRFARGMLAVRFQYYAEDLVQETFVEFARALANGTVDCLRQRELPDSDALANQCYSYLRTILRRKCHALIKKESLRTKRCQALDGLEPLARGPEPPEAVEKRDIRTLVGLALEQRTPEHREVIVLHYFEQMAVGEMAEVLRVADGTVKSRLSRARELLKKSLPTVADLLPANEAQGDEDYGHGRARKPVA